MLWVWGTALPGQQSSRTTMTVWWHMCAPGESWRCSSHVHEPLATPCCLLGLRGQPAGSGPSEPQGDCPWWKRLSSPLTESCPHLWAADSFPSFSPGAARRGISAQGQEDHGVAQEPEEDGWGTPGNEAVGATRAKPPPAVFSRVWVAQLPPALGRDKAEGGLALRVTLIHLESPWWLWNSLLTLRNQE